MVRGHMLLDGFDEFGDATEYSPPEAVDREIAEEAFHHVQPGSTGGRKMEGKAWVAPLPCLHLVMLMGGIVVADEVDIPFPRRAFADPVEGNKSLDSYEQWEEKLAENMAWTVLQHSKSQVDKAGAGLADADLFSYADALAIINNWRSAHNYPLNILQDGLRKRARLIDAKCIIAQRIKRLSSITAKLARFPKMRLSMMQDIGGCRAVMNTVKEVNALVESYKKSSIRHEFHHADDYITKPQTSGYRGIHLVYRYFSDRKKTYNGLKIEVQIRSLNQHAWATAVETVGTFINQALKSSQGHDEWLRFFQLMGSAIAKMEDCAVVSGTPSEPDELHAELKYLSHKLGVQSHLEAYGAALKKITSGYAGAHYFLLVLDPTARLINITGFRNEALQEASARYIEVEKEIKGTDKDAVLVSVDSITALNRAYPNYFLDTHVFVSLLKRATA